MKKFNFKKLIFFFITIIFMVSIIFFKYKIDSNKYRDINYTVEKYMTTGLFNKYKLYKIDEIKLSFSDGIIAVITVSGIEDKAPYKNMKYDIFLEKNKNDLWEVKKVYLKELSKSAD